MSGGRQVLGTGWMDAWIFANSPTFLLGRVGRTTCPCPLEHTWASQVKNLPASTGNRRSLRVRKVPWKKEWQPTPLFLLGEVHGQRSLVGYSPWSCKELDTTDRLTVSLLTGGSASKESAWIAGDLGSIPGKEYSSSLEYFCLENLTDWGAWWCKAPYGAVHRVTKRRTWLTAFSICACIYLTH